MKVDDFDYHLPESLIAQHPLSARRESRLLVLPKNATHYDWQFDQIADLLHPGDLLVANDTQVIPARIQTYKPSGGRVEIMLERPVSDAEFLALARSNKPLKLGQLLYLDAIQFELLSREGEFFRFRFRMRQENSDYGDVYDFFQRHGEMPLPPYIKRDQDTDDQHRYQTVYGAMPGAVAAPTAGLHFDSALIDELKAKGIGWDTVTLHVGAGTFKPVKSESIADHKMHRERFSVSQALCDNIRRTKEKGGRIIAVGTTTVRALESAARHGELKASDGDTDIFIYPGYQLRVIDALITNFHLPRSTLLMLVSALAGKDNIMQAYHHAVAERYRFFSYGDAMFIESNQ